jgi:hypothetical protein
VVRSANAGKRSIKKDRVGAGGRGKGSIDKIYTPAFRARAGSTKDIFFFIRLMGFKGIKLIYNLGFGNSYDNIL